MKDLNKVRVVLAKQKKTSKWLPGQSDKDASTNSLTMTY